MAAGPQVQAGELEDPKGAHTPQHPQPRRALVLLLSPRGCPGSVGLIWPGERWQPCWRAPGISPSVLIPKTWTPGTQLLGCATLVWKRYGVKANGYIRAGSCSVDDGAMRKSSSVRN